MCFFIVSSLSNNLQQHGDATSDLPGLQQKSDFSNLRIFDFAIKLFCEISKNCLVNRALQSYCVFAGETGASEKGRNMSENEKRTAELRGAYLQGRREECQEVKAFVAYLIGLYQKNGMPEGAAVLYDLQAKFYARNHSKVELPPLDVEPAACGCNQTR
jgi:hypothetical protein